LELGFVGWWWIFTRKIEEHASWCGEEKETRGRA